MIAEQEKATEVSFKIVLTLPEDQVAKIACGNEPIKAIIAQATYLLAQFANGGMMLSPETVARMDIAAGRRVSEEDLPQLLGEATHKDGRVKAEWLLDPIDIPALDERAKSAGRTRQEYIQEFMDEVKEKGWLWDYSSDGQVSLT